MRLSAAGMMLSGLFVVAAAPVRAQSGTLGVNTTWSVYLAGGNVYSNPPVAAQPGITPPTISLTPGTGRELTVSATGTAAFCGPGVCVAPTPDGPAIGGTNLNASGNISGIIASTSGFLTGVFLGAALPASAPASLNFTALTTNFSMLSPALGQLFFIGDGFTSGALQQRFLVPDGATRLFLGIADGGSFVGDPGFYGDNVGVYTANYSIAPASVVPEPSTWVLLGSGLTILAAVAQRRRRHLV